MRGRKEKIAAWLQNVPTPPWEVSDILVYVGDLCPDHQAIKSALDTVVRILKYSELWRVEIQGVPSPEDIAEVLRRDWDVCDTLLTASDCGTYIICLSKGVTK